MSANIGAKRLQNVSISHMFGLVLVEVGETWIEVGEMNMKCNREPNTEPHAALQNLTEPVKSDK